MFHAKIERVQGALVVIEFHAKYLQACAQVSVLAQCEAAKYANDRQRLERLCRYVGRPPVASERLRALQDGRLLYELRHRWRDGTTHVAFGSLWWVRRSYARARKPWEPVEAAETKESAISRVGQILVLS